MGFDIPMRSSAPLDANSLGTRLQMRNTLQCLDANSVYSGLMMQPPHNYGSVGAQAGLNTLGAIGGAYAVGQMMNQMSNPDVNSAQGYNTNNQYNNPPPPPPQNNYGTNYSGLQGFNTGSPSTGSVYSSNQSNSSYSQYNYGYNSQGQPVTQQNYNSGIYSSYPQQNPQNNYNYSQENYSSYGNNVPTSPQNQYTNYNPSQSNPQQNQYTNYTPSQPNPQQNQYTNYTPSQPAPQQSPTPSQPSRPAPIKRRRQPATGKNIIKGQKVAVEAAGKQLQRVRIALGWEIADTRCDLDASAFMLGAGDKVSGDEWFIFYGQPTSPDNSVNYKVFSDDPNAPDDAEIIIDLERVSPQVQKIAVCVTIYEAFKQNLNFGMVESVYARVIDNTNGSEVMRFELTDRNSAVTALVVGELYRYKGNWKFNAVGSGVNKDLAAFCGLYGVEFE